MADGELAAARMAVLVLRPQCWHVGRWHREKARMRLRGTWRVAIYSWGNLAAGFGATKARVCGMRRLKAAAAMAIFDDADEP